MQVFTMYAVANSTLGMVRDSYNAQGQNSPTFTLGSPVLLKLRLFQDYDESEPYPIANLSPVVSWQAVFDKDFSQATTPILMADNEHIVCHSVTEEINGTEYTFTEVEIPIPDMNTQELVALLGNAEEFYGLHMELVAFDSNAEETFVLQIKNFTVRNRIYFNSEPTEQTPDFLTASQVRALVASGVVFQFSEDGTNWHGTQGELDAYIRFRSASDANAAWSEAILLPSRNDGEITSLQSRIAALEALAMGTLTVTHTGTAPAGAKWSVDSGTTWRDFGTSATLAPGSYTVTFKSVTGYTAPSSQSVTLTAGGTQSVSVAYTAVATTGTVTLTFSGTPPQGAAWTVDGNSYTSGQTATLDPGTYAITYASVTGYDSPSTPTSVTVAAGDALSLSAEYTEQAQSGGYTVSGALNAADGTYLPDASKTGRNNSPVWANGTWYLAYGYDLEDEILVWALTTQTPTSSLSFSHSPPYLVASDDASAPPTSGWSGGVTVTAGS